MNELIEGLWKEFMCTPLVNGGYTKKDGFVKAIQTACKAQRNACARAYNKHYGDSEHYDECCGLEIFTSQIERQDYE